MPMITRNFLIKGIFGKKTYAQSTDEQIVILWVPLFKMYFLKRFIAYKRNVISGHEKITRIWIFSCEILEKAIKKKFKYYIK